MKEKVITNQKRRLKQQYYQALLETGKKKKHERKIYVRSNAGVAGVLKVVGKIKNSRLLHAKRISSKEYLAGIATSP